MKKFVECMIKVIVLAALVFPVAGFSDQGVQELGGKSGIVRFSTNGDYGELKEQLNLVITELGVKISNVSHISNMLERTREAVGSENSVYRNAEAFEFCSATLSYNMLAANPHDIIYCPFIIYLYEITTQPGVIHIAYRKIPELGDAKSIAALREINKKLESIVRQTLE